LLTAEKTANNFRGLLYFAIPGILAFPWYMIQLMLVCGCTW